MSARGASALEPMGATEWGGGVGLSGRYAVAPPARGTAEPARWRGAPGADWAARRCELQAGSALRLPARPGGGVRPLLSSLLVTQVLSLVLALCASCSAFVAPAASLRQTRTASQQEVSNP